MDVKQKKHYSVEFGHIYTDEVEVNNSQLASIDYLKSASTAWDFSYDLVVLIDNYNPKKHVLSENKVLSALKDNGVEPDHVAYEGSLINNAQLLLESIKSSKLKRNYLSYIKAHSKYPCSLLTASWYLTRLGKLDAKDIFLQINGKKFKPAQRLINILPRYYKPVEERALGIIAASDHREAIHSIQDLFYEDEPVNKIGLY